LFANAPLATLKLDSLTAFGERSTTLRVRIPTSAGPSLLRAVVASAGDIDARNDTLTTVVEISPAAGAVLVSTSPDYDARDAIGVLRGALALPTRGFYRVAPGMWRLEGALAPVTEEDVRRAAAEAPLGVLPGAPSIFGP